MKIPKAVWLFIIALLVLAVEASLNGQSQTSPSGQFQCLTADCSSATYAFGPEDAGRRLRACLTVTDAVGAKATSCQPITIRGACSIFTADVIVDSSQRVNILDLAAMAFSFGSTLDRSPWFEASDINADGIVDMQDISCAASYFDSTVPLV